MIRVKEYRHLNKYKFSKKYTRVKYLRMRNKKSFYKRVRFYKANLHLICSLNNTIITITDMKGNVVKTTSCGTLGYTGFKKKRNDTIINTIEKVTAFLQKNGVNRIIKFRSRGVEGSKLDLRLLFIQHLLKANIRILSIKVYRGYASNGCRQKKPRKAKKRRVNNYDFY
jgi:small subunit ribosomal protein S11